MGIPEAADYCQEHFEFDKLNTDAHHKLIRHRRENGLVAIIRPVYYGLADDRSKMFEAMVWDTKDVEVFGTDKHNHDDVGYKIHFITDEEDEILDKLFPTYEAAELGCVKKIEELLKERK